jgi:cytochrome c peroxidase
MLTHSTIPAALRASLLPLLLATLGGCGSDGPTTIPESPVVVVTPPPAATPLPFAGVTAALTISPTQLPNYAAPTLPAHYAGLIGSNTDNGRNAPITDAGATLGRVLFHDRQLSVNNTKSCASCHAQASGFSDEAQLSVGLEGGLTGAHSMRLANARFYGPGSFFWDRRAATLEAQAIEPIQNAVEMGFDVTHGGLAAVTARLQGFAYYRELFALVYGDSTVTVDRMQRAIAQYVRSIISTSSRWDTGYAQVFNPGLPDRGVNTPIPTFTAQENRGRELFFTAPPQGGGGCAACHVAPSFALAGNSLSNGLDAGETRIFKSPSLKNGGVPGRFMHDGRFSTLDQVVAHYNNGVQDGPALDQRLRGPGGTPLRLNLNAGDRAALVAFLQTLTDPQLAGDAKFGDPFRR